MSRQWTDRQTTLLEAIKRHQTANKSYLSTGIQILELSNRAYELFKVRKSDEKRALLNQVLSNCKLEGKNLGITHKKPFALLTKGFSRPNWLRDQEGFYGGVFRRASVEIANLRRKPQKVSTSFYIRTPEQRQNSAIEKPRRENFRGFASNLSRDQDSLR